MKDVNGIELKAGQIVEVKGSFFKCDNGLYVIERVPGDENWRGKYCSLDKFTKSGKFSISKYSTSSWPLAPCTSDYVKNAEARTHNAANATITVIGTLENHVERFELRKLEKDIKNQWLNDYVKSEMESRIEEIKRSIGMK